jgi:hypothetical protein
MKHAIAFLAVFGMLGLTSCSKKESGESAPTADQAPAAAAQQQQAAGPHAVVRLKNGDKVPGVIVASTQADMVVAGDDGIERKIPLGQVKSVDYSETQAAAPAAQASRAPAMPRPQAPAATPTAAAPAPAPVTPPPTTKTYVLPAGSEVSVRTNEAIDSGTAAEGQTFDAQVTRDARDADGDVVIPRHTPARIVIVSASKGGRFRGQSDLTLDLQSVTINGKTHAIETSAIQQKGKTGVGANKRTATYTGGGAALGAIIGAIAGGGKGAAIGAGAGAGAGVLTQAITRGGAIKVPAETVLTFSLDKPLRVVAE